MMEILDKNIVYDLLCTPDLLKYLTNKEKSEFCQCSKFIFNKCEKYRLNTLHLFVYKEFELKKNSNKLTNEEILNNQVNHINSVINRYRYYATELGIGCDYNNYLVNYTVQSLQNLTKLYLVSIIMPNTTFNFVLQRLKNLNTLWLDEFILGLIKNFPAQLKFPPYLKNLNWSNCKQLDVIDQHPIKLQDYLSECDPYTLAIMEIPIDSIKNLNYLTSLDMELEYTDTINQLIANNPNLIQLNTIIQALNNETLKLIANRHSLTKLSFYYDIYGSKLNVTSFTQLPYLKTLEFDIINTYATKFVKNLIKNSKNLKNLKFPWFKNTQTDLIELISDLDILETLILLNCSDYTNFLDYKLPNSKLKYLEFIGFDPLKVDFGLFSNLAELKRVKVMIKPRFCKFDEIRAHCENLKGWRVFIDRLFIQCWKL